MPCLWRAWVITRTIAKPDVCKWMKALLGRVRAVDPVWKVNGFLVDDAAVEIDPIRSWLRNIVKKCCNPEVQREIFKRLGEIVHSIWRGVEFSVALERFTQDFIDQTSFLLYFTATGVPKIEMWLTTMKTLPLASQEASGAIEAYLVKLKVKLYRRQTKVIPFKMLRSIACSSWHRALQIPDSAVTLDDKNHVFAKVVSQKGASQMHLVWNSGSEFAFCDCEWSKQGNLCKHVIKVNMVCENHQGCQSSMSFQSFQKILKNLWTKPTEDSVSMDLATAWTHQMLDQIQNLVELSRTSDIGSIVNNLPLRWVAKKCRTSLRKPLSVMAALPSTSKSDVR